MADTDMPKYRLHEDEDGKHLYYAAYNVRVATFARGVPVSERERIVAALSASPVGEGASASPIPTEQAGGPVVGWIDWHGGSDAPVPIGTPCWVRFRDGFECKAHMGIRWTHWDLPTDVVAYALSAPSTTSTAEQPGEGEAPVNGRRFVLYWLDQGPVPAAFVDDLNGYITGGSGRCLAALEAHGAMVFQKAADLSRPTPATPEGLRPFGLSPLEIKRIRSALIDGLEKAYWAGSEVAQGFDAAKEADAVLAALQPQAQGGE